MVLLNNYDYDVLACLAIDLGIGPPNYTLTKKTLVENLSRVIAIEKRELKSRNDAIIYDRRIKKLLFDHREFLKSSTKEREDYWKERFIEIQNSKSDGFTIQKGDGLFRTLVKEAPLLINGEPLLNGSQTAIEDRFKTFTEIDAEMSQIATRQNNMSSGRQSGPRSPRISNHSPVQTFQDIESALASSARLVQTEPPNPVTRPHVMMPPESMEVHIFPDQGIMIADPHNGVIISEPTEDLFTVERTGRAPRRGRSPRRNTDQFEFVEPEDLSTTPPIDREVTVHTLNDGREITVTSFTVPNTTPQHITTRVVNGIEMAVIHNPFFDIPSPEGTVSATGPVFITSTGGEIPLDKITDYSDENTIMEVDYEDPDDEDEREIEEIERIDRERRNPVAPPNMVSFNEIPNNTAQPVNPFRTFDEIVNGTRQS